MSENTDFNNEEAANKLRSNVFMQGFLSELDNDMSPKDMGELYERAKEVLTDDKYLEKIRDKIHDKMKGFEGVSSNSSTGVSRGGGMNNQAPQTKQQINNSQGSAAPSSKHTEFDQYGRIKNPNYSKIKASIIDKLCERNVPAEELDKILEMTRRMAGMSAEELRQAEANAAAKKGNHEITYNDVSLPKGNSISDKLEEVKMMAYCRKSITDPTIDMLKLKDYIFYTAIKDQERTEEDAAIKARIAAKLINHTLKENFANNQELVDVVRSIGKINPDLELWSTAVVKKCGSSTVRYYSEDGNFLQLGDKEQQFKNSLAYDSLDRAISGKHPMDHHAFKFMLFEMKVPPVEELKAFRTYFASGADAVNSKLFDRMKNIVEQDAKYVPEIMDLLHHKAIKGYDEDYDNVLLTCLKQNPALITQARYNHIRDNYEAIKENRKKAIEFGYFGYIKGGNIIPYMESVNPKLKENWQESQRQQTNLNQGISRGGMGE